MNIPEGSALLAAFFTSICFLLAVPGAQKKAPNEPEPPIEPREKPLIGEPPGWQR